jgi:hypothetical protein
MQPVSRGCCSEEDADVQGEAVTQPKAATDYLNRGQLNEEGRVE